ncbi:hypothetical protein Pmani_005406 [Petrolisthes manimaculis]|uniref:Secreted protein n=1 Tax=Petrolisthes manimaculis TaxID=1843537 RepID=A0AAE1QEQ4_9EUCA|nr:hypothetical protein Pmani_005406 [Petrolisthes manimaculis]
MLRRPFLFNMASLWCVRRQLMVTTAGVWLRQPADLRIWCHTSPTVRRTSAVTTPLYPSIVPATPLTLMARRVTLTGPCVVLLQPHLSKHLHKSPMTAPPHVIVA